MSHALLRGLSINGAASFLGVSAGSVRRWLRDGAVPQAAAIALERREWVSLEAARYLETVAYWRGVEANQRLMRGQGTARERAAVAWGAVPAMDGGGSPRTDDSRRAFLFEVVDARPA